MCTMKQPKQTVVQPTTPVSAPEPVAETLSIGAASRKKANTAATAGNALMIARDMSLGMTGGSGLGVQ